MGRTPLIELDSRDAGAVDGRQIRAVAFQDVRLEYLGGVLDHTGLTPTGPALVIGGGRGPLPGSLARLGYDVTAVDPSQAATDMARAASEEDGLAVAHRTAPAERLGLDDAAFPLVYCADTFEIAPDLDRVTAEAARVLAPGGVLVYDTVNRTLLARAVYLGAFQALPATRIMPAGRYAAARLRTPAELAASLARQGLRNEDICDFAPRDPRALVTAVRARRAGRITDAEIPPIVGFRLAPGSRPLVTYLGYARRG